jgi:hypothetical protein
VPERQERGHTVELALLVRGKDLLVAGLDPLEADWPTFVLLLQPAGEQRSVDSKPRMDPERAVDTSSDEIGDNEDERDDERDEEAQRDADTRERDERRSLDFARLELLA